MSKASEKTVKGETDRVLDCVFLPVLATSRVGIHTVCAWSAWERSTQSRLLREPTVRIVRGCHCVCFAPGGLFLRGEPSPAFLTVLAPLPPRRSGSCTRGVRSWIWRREWRRASPYLLPHLPDPLPTLWVRKPVLRFLPPRERIGASPIFLRGG